MMDGSDFGYHFGLHHHLEKKDSSMMMMMMMICTESIKQTIINCSTKNKTKERKNTFSAVFFRAKKPHTMLKEQRKKK